MSVSVHLEAVDREAIPDLISRIVAAVGDSASVQVDVRGGGGTSAADDRVPALPRDDVGPDDWLDAFPAEGVAPPASAPSTDSGSAPRGDQPVELLYEPAAVPPGRDHPSGEGLRSRLRPGEALYATAGRARATLGAAARHVREQVSRIARRAAVSPAHREPAQASSIRPCRVVADLTARAAAYRHGLDARRTRRALRAGIGILLVATGVLALMRFWDAPPGRQRDGRAALVQPVLGRADGTLGGNSAAVVNSPDRPAGADLGGAATDDRAPVANDRGEVPPARPRTIAAVGRVRAAETTPVRSANVQTTARAAFVGDLSVSSTPPGASVFVNNRTVGTTPLTLKRLPVATYAVRVDLAGFERWSRAVQVSAGQHVRVHPTLGPATASAPERRVP